MTRRRPRLKLRALLLQEGKKKMAGGWNQKGGNGDAGNRSFMEGGGRRLWGTLTVKATTSGYKRKVQEDKKPSAR